MRILLVEDSQILLRNVRRALRHEGFTVDTAADGAEGLAAAEANDYDVLVLDIMFTKTRWSYFAPSPADGG
ncbi:MAG: response regulator [Chthoniobacterales bacterium]|nr:response regulator [Chthoniobacterales bacterium]